MDDATQSIRVGLALLMLAGATVWDLHTRRVPNRYWTLFMVAALVLLAGDLTDPDEAARHQALLWTGVALGSCGILYGLWYVGFLAGGADAKGLLVLALLLPIPLHGPAGIVLTPMFYVLATSVVLVALAPTWFLTCNLLRGRASGWATLLGTQMNLEEVRRRRVWPMERVGQDGQITRRYWQRRDEDLGDVLADLQRAGADRVWVTPQLPFMVPMMLALATWVWWL